jgi:hypothetical protein
MNSDRQDWMLVHKANGAPLYWVAINGQCCLANEPPPIAEWHPSLRNSMPVLWRLDYHLETIVWDDAGEDEHLNAQQIQHRMMIATDDQIQRAYQKLGLQIAKAMETR